MLCMTQEQRRGCRGVQSLPTGNHYTCTAYTTPFDSHCLAVRLMGGVLGAHMLKHRKPIGWVNKINKP